MSCPPDFLHRVSEICLALPEATRDDSGSHASFSVRGKKFAYYLHDHHGDGIISVCFKVAKGSAGLLIDSDEDLFYSPAYIGPRGWVGLRLDLGDINWEEVRDLVTASYGLTAPQAARGQDR